jgi:hypothetical protein
MLIWILLGVGLLAAAMAWRVDGVDVGGVVPQGAGGDGAGGAAGGGRYAVLPAGGACAKYSDVSAGRCERPPAERQRTCRQHTPKLT